MALGYGSGGEARRPLGLAVVGGLVVSQMMTLYLTPVVYTYMSSLVAWTGRARAASATGAAVTDLRIKHEFFRNIYPPAHRHQPADGRDRAVRRGRLSRAAGQRSAERRFPHPADHRRLPGASPETMASAVATPLENQFSTIAGLNAMTSVNSLGSTQITLEFDLNRSMDGAAVDVQAAITQAAGCCPRACRRRRRSPRSTRPISRSFTGPDLEAGSAVDLDEYAETRVAQRISMSSGVAQVQVLGQQKYAVHVQMDPHAHGLASGRHQ